MDICGKHYGGNIAFEGSICPACDEVADLAGQITDLKDKISELEEEE